MRKISSVFYITIALIILAVGYGVLASESFEIFTANAKNFVASTFGWYYMLIMSLLVALSVFLIFSPYGKIRLGKDTDRPQFSTFTWIAMLFSAGMGIGLVFYGQLNRYPIMQLVQQLLNQIRMKLLKKRFVSPSSTGVCMCGRCMVLLH